MKLNHRIQQIQEKLHELIQKDKKHKIFGSEEGGHGYKLNPPLSELDLNVFESANHIILPEEYRAFLTQIANGGAGPYYGLYSLEKGIKEADDYSTNENITVEKSFTLDFPVSRQETEKFMQYYNDCMDEGADDEIKYMEIPDPLTGVIFLSEYGCGWSYLLVVKGEMAGSVWFHGDYFCPVFVKNKLWTFFDWYEDWLDDSLETLNPKQKKTEFDANQSIINYDGWKLKEIPKEVFACKNLKKLVFSRNDLPEFPKKITQFTELRTLDLSMTPIVEIPDEIEALTKLKKLRLNYNYHLNLPDTLGKLNDLEELSMYYNYKIPAIPDVVSTLPKLRKLHFSYCSELKKIPDTIGYLSNLELLQLNDSSNLTALPESITQLKNLKYLYIDNTKINNLPVGFENLQNLEALGINIPDLDLADVVDKIKHLPKLSWLRISNQLDFPATFSDLHNIKRLVIEQNYDLWHKGYKTLPIPENLTLLPNLEDLNLMNNNQANHLPESMGKLKHLKKLQISSTCIQVLPESMQYLTQIEQIEGALNKDKTNSFGLFPEEKEKLIRWFPNAKIWIW